MTFEQSCKRVIFTEFNQVVQVIIVLERASQLDNIWMTANLQQDISFLIDVLNSVVDNHKVFGESFHGQSFFCLGVLYQKYVTKGTLAKFS